MRAAAERAYALAPEDPIIVNNLAATLLIQRDRPELAAKLTLGLLAQHPEKIEAVGNHAAALLLNHRLDEADDILRAIDSSKLNPSQSTLYHLDLFEIQLERGRVRDAKRTAERIDLAHLYPPQRAWFSNALERVKAGR